MLRESLIIELDSIDSTNNYAMQLIDANKAQPGMTIVAQNQWAGKGQRGNIWVDAPGKSLSMSIIAAPKQAIREQFVFSASVAIAIANVLRNLHSNWNVYIKWPNDIIVNDKKAGGILIENVLRGSNWTHSVIGIGLNVQQEKFPGNLPHAISLKMGSGNDIDITKLRDDIRESIMACSLFPQPPGQIMGRYNQFLYRRGMKQRFSNSSEKWEATIQNAHDDGTLEVQKEDGSVEFYNHGQAVWEWGE